MDDKDWDRRYSQAELVWSADPNIWVREFVRDLVPGRALDVAAGEGRNAIWLAGKGWEVIATDFSAVAIERAQALADDGLQPDARERLVFAIADAMQVPPGVDGDRDLTVLSYLHLPDDQWQRAIQAAVETLAPGGALLVIGHARVNLTDGVGGPQDPGVLRDPDAIESSLNGLPVSVELSEIRRREVAGADRPALDTVVLARRQPH